MFVHWIEGASLEGVASQARRGPVMPRRQNVPPEAPGQLIEPCKAAALNIRGLFEFEAIKAKRGIAGFGLQVQRLRLKTSFEDK